MTGFKKFYSKILLFGEYSLIKGSKALSMPFDKYYGQLVFDENSDSKSNHYSVKYLVEYLEYLKSIDNGLLDLNTLEKDINSGLKFEINIPISYGLGSSGAIVASIYDAYTKEKESDTGKLKQIFSMMESFYHGKSSGLDPLVSYLNKALLVESSGEVKTISLHDKGNTNSAMFIIDSFSSGETQPLVKWFLEKYGEKDFRNKIDQNLTPLNNRCIEAILNNDKGLLELNIALLSEFSLKYFSPMIPVSIKEIWEKGLYSGDYYLKLCGSGGGGMMLGFSNNIEKTKTTLQQNDFQSIIFL